MSTKSGITLYRIVQVKKIALPNQKQKQKISDLYRLIFIIYLLNKWHKIPFQAHATQPIPQPAGQPWATHPLLQVLLSK